MSSKSKAKVSPVEYADALRDLAKNGVPREPDEERLLDIVRLSLQIARDAFKRLDRRRSDLRE